MALAKGMMESSSLCFNHFLSHLIEDFELWKLTEKMGAKYVILFLKFYLEIIFSFENL